MKKLICFILSFSLLLFGNSLTVSASENTITETIDYLDDGSCFVTVIEVEPDNSLISMFSTSTTTTAKKTTTYKSSSGTSLWSISVTGTFSYVKGKSSKCTSSTITTAVYSALWKVSNKSASKSGNKASATATGTQYYLSVPAGSVTKTVTLTCSINGVLS